MKSPNEQYLIAQELNKLESFLAGQDCNIVGYEVDGEYRIAISSNIGMFPSFYIKDIISLSALHGFSWYISNSCASVHRRDLFIIIY